MNLPEILFARALMAPGGFGKDEPLEEILTYTCDGTETGNTYFTEDNDGHPLRLKRAVVRVALGEVTAAGTFSADVQSGSKVLGQIYTTYSASATGNKNAACFEQDGGFWVSRQTAFSNSGLPNVIASLYYTYKDKTSDYPYIDRVRLTRAVPAGTVIQILGVRA